jgi:ATP/maltotriose-dependent transcriptional regulator MalT
MAGSVVGVPQVAIGVITYPALGTSERIAGVDVSSPPPLVGRASEREALAFALEGLVAGRGAIVVIEGEPGIGKSALLAELARSAGEARCAVRGARASEFEADLPYLIWREALDVEFERGDRHGVHAALRGALEELAATDSLVLCLDDVHWADPASLDALAALMRRPPAGPVLLALASRAGQIPPLLAGALSGALRDGRATQIALRRLTQAEAVELVGEAANEIYAQAGGNPFYLEQLARVRAAAGDGSVPPTVAAAVAAELTALTDGARRMLDGAAIAGDPFEAGLAAAVAELPDAESLAALDELLALALVRETGTPRRFAFRHPVVRNAVYDATPGGWRLGAHARAAAALQRSGAGPVERAHHVEQAAGPGDEEAIDVLAGAARELQSPAPAAAARFHAAALRLLPDSAEHRDRRALIVGLLADAQAAAGDPFAARETLLEALRTAPGERRLALTVALANSEWWLGRNDDARRRLQVALGELPAEPSADRIRLRLALGLVALSACELSEVQAQVSDARDDARAIGDPVFEVAALAAGALARVTEADGPEAAGALQDLSGALERLTPEQLATRLPALWMQGRAHHALGRFDAALADLERGSAMAADTGRQSIQLLLILESVPTLIELGRTADAAAAAEQGLERGRLSGIPRVLVWAHAMLASARLAAGDVAETIRHAGEAAAIAAPPGFHAACQPGWCLGAALTAAGNADRAVAALVDAFGGAALDAVLPVQRPAAAADLVEAQLACGDVDAAEAALAHGHAAARRAGTAWAAAVTGMARSAVLLARSDAEEAVAAATAALQDATGAPLLAARLRLLEGRALAAAGRREAAVDALSAAEAELDGFGALRRRDEAVRELRRLGRRVLRPARDGAPGALSPLTARELEIAELVAAGRTNREVAEQLVLSTRTIEAHLRNIYGKLEVRSRVELAREVRRIGEGGS